MKYLRYNLSISKYFQLRIRKETYNTFNLVKFLKIPDDISRILLRLRNLEDGENVFDLVHLTIKTTMFSQRHSQIL